ncbi:MAG TPA: dihydroneopterin aldolase [Burkholderiaceae bacterium]|nr:dihydroneopterin aldolase [Burkholderiaceae bacterium]
MHALRQTVTTLPLADNGRDVLDLIFIEGLQAQTVIGIHDNELQVPQTVSIDLAAGVPRALACSTDRLGDTIDYGAVRAAVLQLLQTHRVQLLEALAEQIAQLLLERFGAHWVRVVAVKPRKFDDVDAVGVALERRRDPRQREASVLHLIGSGMVPGQGH